MGDDGRRAKDAKALDREKGEKGERRERGRRMMDDGWGMIGFGAGLVAGWIAAGVMPNGN